MTGLVTRHGRTIAASAVVAFAAAALLFAVRKNGAPSFDGPRARRAMTAVTLAGLLLGAIGTVRLIWVFGLNGGEGDLTIDAQRMASLRALNAKTDAASLIATSRHNTPYATEARKPNRWYGYSASSSRRFFFEGFAYAFTARDERALLHPAASPTMRRSRRGRPPLSPAGWRRRG